VEFGDGADAARDLQRRLSFDGVPAGKPTFSRRTGDRRALNSAPRLRAGCYSLFFILFTLAIAYGADKRPTASKPSAETMWKKYENGRFGFVLTYPASLIGSREPDNGDGREFHSRDKEFSVAAFAHFFVPDSDDSFEARWQEELNTPDVTITYKKKTDSWYVVSGLTKTGTEYYHKLMIKGKNWAAFHITYPHAKHDKYNPWVERIEKEFVAFREGDYDRLD
jgi:hypothetical protein